MTALRLKNRAERICPVFESYPSLLVECIHGIIMIMETKPPSGHIAGEVGGFVGNELTVFIQRLGSELGGVLQQKLPELCLALLPGRVLREIMLLHRIGV